jgi:hypothetical protein
MAPGLSLLRGFQVRLGDGPPVAFARKKAEALLAYLALNPGHAHPRDKLAALLWGDATHEAARLKRMRATDNADPPAEAAQERDPAVDGRPQKALGKTTEDIL